MRRLPSSSPAARVLVSGLLWAAACSSSSADKAPGMGQSIRCTPGDIRTCQGASACETEATQECFPSGDGWSVCSCLRLGTGGSGSSTTASSGGSGASGGAAETGGTGGTPSNSGTSAGGEGSGSGGDPGGAGAAGLAGQGGANDCDPDERQLFRASLDLSGELTLFADGAELPAGKYRIRYVDGCMKYADSQDWAIHASEDQTSACFLGSSAGDKLQILPGSFGYLAESGGFADFEECVAHNLALPPIKFDFAGGPLGIWLADSNTLDNVAGLDGRNPTWELEPVSKCTPATGD